MLGCQVMLSIGNGGGGGAAGNGGGTEVSGGNCGKILGCTARRRGTTLGGVVPGG